MGHFLGFVGVADPLAAEPFQAVVVPAVELIERRLIPSLEALHQHAVTTQVDVVNS